MMPHDNFWDLVSRYVNIYRSDAVGTTASSVISEDGTEVPTDVLLAGVSWDTSSHFMSTAQACGVGVPHEPTLDTAETALLATIPSSQLHHQSANPVSRQQGYIKALLL